MYKRAWWLSLLTKMWGLPMFRQILIYPTSLERDICKPGSLILSYKLLELAASMTEKIKFNYLPSLRFAYPFQYERCISSIVVKLIF